MSTMTQSILTTVKRTLGLSEDYTVFDNEIITHINSVFGDLHQLGVGPLVGFEIEDVNATWGDFLANDVVLNATRSYMYLRVKQLFDPSTIGFVLTAQKEAIEKAEWRLMVAADIVPDGDDESQFILDGGTP